jgi:glucose/mannose-6-phosphate isomerase
MLLDSDQHPRERERFQLTGEIISATKGSPPVIVSESVGETRTARMFEAVMLGDLVSLQLAAMAGIDPTPVVAIDELKSRLGRQ